MVRKVLVTGASGFIGANVCRRLSDRGYEVYSLMYEGKKPDGTKRLNGDITERNSLTFPDIDDVVHCAGILESSHPTREMMWKVNYNGTVNVWKESKRAGAKHFVFMSTIMVYGPNGTLKRPLKESMEPDPKDTYGKTKLSCERFLRKESSKGGPHVCVLRPPVIYGPGMNDNSSGMKTFLSVKKGIIPLVKDGDTVYNMLYVDNMVQAILLALENRESYEVYNINEGPYTLKEVISEISKQMGKEKGYKRYPKMVLWLITLLSSINSRLFKGPPLMSWTKYVGLTSDVWNMDFEKAKKKLNYRPRIDLQEGIRRTLEYYGWEE